MATKAAGGTRVENLLVELLTEELPPKSLKTLAKAFGDGLAVELRQDGFLKSESVTRVFATPRRLAVLISHVLEQSPDKRVEFTGPPVTAPQQAIAGFARKNGVSIEDLIQIDTPKGKIFSRRSCGGATATRVSLARCTAW